MSLHVQGHLTVVKGLAYEELLVDNSTAVRLTGTGLPLPLSNTRRVLVQPADGTVRWLALADDEATASSGFKLQKDEYLVYDGDWQDLSFFRDSLQGSDVTIRVHYFGA